MAGIAIGIGGCVFIGTMDACGSSMRWVGAFLFAVGLFTVFSFRLDLYTGKVGYLFDNRPSFAVDLLVIILGNFIGCAIVGFAMPLDTAVAICQLKLDDFDVFKVLMKGVFCGMLMFIAADCYKQFKHHIATFVCVPVFILAGFEHSIADMFYFCSANILTFDALVFIIVVIIGNAIGGVAIPLCRKYMYEE